MRLVGYLKINTHCSKLNYLGIGDILPTRYTNFLGDVLHFSAIKVRHKAAAWLSLCTHGVLHAAGVWVCEELQINLYGQSPQYRHLYIQPTCLTTHTQTHTHTFALNPLAFHFIYPFCVLNAT